MNAVTDSIMSHTSDPNVRAAMLMGSYLESGWNPGSVGDNGSSFGPFQIHLPAHPGVTAQQAEDPQFAVAFMLPAYQNGVSQVSSSLWQTAPALAAATAAYKAERPLVMYPASRYNAAWPNVIQVLGGNTTLGGSGTGSTAPGNTATPGTATDTSLQSTIAESFYPILNYLWMAGLVVGGVILTGVGLYLLITGTVPTAPTINVQLPKETKHATRETRATQPQPSTPSPKPLPARAVRVTPRPTLKATAGKPQPPKPIVLNTRREISA